MQRVLTIIWWWRGRGETAITDGGEAPRRPRGFDDGFDEGFG